MAESIEVFKIEDGDGWPNAVDAIEGLSGQSLEEFIDQQATAGQDVCINAADGKCQLTGEVCRWREQGMVETGMGGLTPGMVDYVSAEISCGRSDCPSDQPVQKLARTLKAFSRLAKDGNDEVEAQTRPLLREASTRADAIVEPAEAEAERDILQPGRERAQAVIKTAENKAKRFTKNARTEAKNVRTAADDEAESIRASVLARVLAQAEATSNERAKLF